MGGISGFFGFYRTVLDMGPLLTRVDMLEFFMFGLRIQLCHTKPPSESY